MKVYQKYMESFKVKRMGKKHPVIMLVDNDDGAKDIKKQLKGKNFNEPFSYYRENLYVVPYLTKT